MSEYPIITPSSPPKERSELFTSKKTIATQTSTPPPQAQGLSPPRTPPLTASANKEDIVDDDNTRDLKQQQQFPKTKARLVGMGEFEPEHHFYPRVLNAQIHPLVQSFFTLGNERIIARYTHLNPRVKAETLREILSYKPKYFQWAGSSFF